MRTFLQVLLVIYLVGMIGSCVMSDTLGQWILNSPIWVRVLCLLPITIYTVVSLIDALGELFHFDFGYNRRREKRDAEEIKNSSGRVQKRWWRKYH